MGCRVDVTIHASPERVWSILTDARGFPRWNSTVKSLEGEIREGGRLRLRVPDTDRVFTPTISDVVPNEHMTWSGGFGPIFKGVRDFTLRPHGDGSTDFTMEERFSGLMVPLFEGPDFGPIFEVYANDLKREAERAA
jgi:uncharacterized protein YndB with AHSA1/START domain